MTRRAFALLGCYVEIRQADGPPTAMRSARAALATVQRLMSFHDPGSELSRLNRSAHLGAQSVHPWTWRVLRACAELYRTSGGLFDPCVAPRLVRRGLLPRPQGPEPDLRAGFCQVELPAPQVVRFRQPLWLDLGGIAKGFAVDAAIAALRAAGVRTAVVNAGGDLRVLGSAAQPIAVRNARSPNCIRQIGWLANGACATSGDYFAGPEGGSAIEQPSGAAPRATCVSHRPRAVTVIAPRCLLADALTKLLMLDAALGARLLAFHRARQVDGQ